MKENFFRDMMARWGVKPSSKKSKHWEPQVVAELLADPELVSAKVAPPAKPVPSAGPSQTPLAAAVARPEPKRLSPEEELFLRTMGQMGVRSMDRPVVFDQVSEKQRRPKAPAQEEDRDLFLSALNGLTEVVAKEIEPDKETQLALSKRKLSKREAHLPGACLDLHGKTVEEALKELTHFVASEFASSSHSVMVITGKGRHSPGGSSILKPAVENWIRLRGKRFIEQYAEAPTTLGGGGAFVLFLRQT